MRVTEIPGHVPDANLRISNDAVRKVLEESGIEYLVTVPESLYEVLLRDVIRSSSMKIIQVCRECEGLSICSGLTYGGKKAALLASFKGLYNSIDSLLGVAVRTESPFLMLFSEASAQAKRAGDPEGGCYTAEILKAINVPYYEVTSDEELYRIKEALEQIKTSSKPVAVILRW